MALGTRRSACTAARRTRSASKGSGTSYRKRRPDRGRGPAATARSFPHFELRLLPLHSPPVSLRQSLRREVLDPLAVLQERLLRRRVDQLLELERLLHRVREVEPADDHDEARGDRLPENPGPETRQDTVEDGDRARPGAGLRDVAQDRDEQEEDPDDEQRSGNLETEVLVDVREQPEEPGAVSLHERAKSPELKSFIRFSPTHAPAAMANLRTPLFEWHTAHGARVVEFGGWDMPLQYTGIVEEHLAVRRAAGLFDVSHMGKLLLEGPGVAELANTLSTNDIPVTPGRARYTHLLDERGRILDDVIFTSLGPDRFLCVCNAGPRPRIVEWIRLHLRGQRLTDLTPDFLCLALPA